MNRLIEAVLVNNHESNNYAPYRILTRMVNDLADKQFEDLTMDQLLTSKAPCAWILMDARFKCLQSSAGAHYICSIIDQLGGMTRIQNLQTLRWVLRQHASIGSVTPAQMWHVIGFGAVDFLRECFHLLPTEPVNSFMDRFFSNCFRSEYPICIPEVALEVVRFLTEEKGIPLFQSTVTRIIQSNNSAFGKVIDYLVCQKRYRVTSGDPSQSTEWQQQLASMHAWEALLHMTKTQHDLAITLYMTRNVNHEVMIELMRLYPNHQITDYHSCSVIYEHFKTTAAFAEYRQTILRSIARGAIGSDRDDTTLQNVALVAMHYLDWEVFEAACRRKTASDQDQSLIHKFLRISHHKNTDEPAAFFRKMLDTFFTSSNTFEIPDNFKNDNSVVGILAGCRISKDALVNLVHVKQNGGHWTVQVLEHVYSMCGGHVPDFDLIVKHAPAETILWYATRSGEEIPVTVCPQRSDITRATWTAQGKKGIDHIRPEHFRWLNEYRHHATTTIPERSRRAIGFGGLLDYILCHITCETYPCNQIEAIANLDFIFSHYPPIVQFLTKGKKAPAEVNHAAYTCHAFFKLCQKHKIHLHIGPPLQFSFLPSDSEHLKELLTINGGKITAQHPWMNELFRKACTQGKLDIMKYLVKRHGYRVDGPAVELQDNVLAYAIRHRWLSHPRVISKKTRSTFLLMIPGQQRSHRLDNMGYASRTSDEELGKLLARS